MLRIIGGQYRSRQLHSPPDAAVTRPYTARVKEAVFNLLRGWWEDARVVDLYAGVGTMGLEAASRGAAWVLMVERDRKMARLARENIDELGCGDRVELMQGDVAGLAAMSAVLEPVDIVFIDPPYKDMEDAEGRRSVLELAGRWREKMKERSFLVLRSPIGPDHVELKIDGMDGPEAHQYAKDMWVLLYCPARDGAGQGDAGIAGSADTEDEA